MQRITINNVKYKFNCYFAIVEKIRGSNGNPCCRADIQVWNEDENKQLFWEDLKGTYVAEKIGNFVQNMINNEEKQ